MFRYAGNLMEGGMPTTPICNPHICRVLLGTAGCSGVLWGDVGFIGRFQKKCKKNHF